MDEFAGPRRRRRRLDWNRVRRASNNARNYGAAVGHPDACRQCLANVPSHLPILSHFCAWTVRACMHREPIDPNFCPRTTMGGRARSIERRKRREYGSMDHFFLLSSCLREMGGRFRSEAVQQFFGFFNERGVFLLS